jgi:hypothetical protein
MSTKSLLVVSAGLNAVLLAGLAYLLTSRSAPAPPPPTSAPATNAAAVQGAGRPAEPARPPAPTPGKPGVQFDWRLVESNDYRQYIANLRAIGCPEETIRDIIIADVNKVFQSRLAGLRKPGQEFKYWQTRARAVAGPPLALEMLKQQHELDREKRALLKELLGVDVAEAPATGTEGLSALRETLSFLSPDKRDRVLELEVEFNEKMARTFSPSAPDPGDAAERLRLRKEKAAELAKVLTPQELEDYELRMSDTAQRMHIELDGFDATEKEFRDIFKLRKKFDEENGTFAADPADADSLKRWEEARKELDEQIKQVLGKSRYQEYERAQDPAYKGALRVAERQGLGVEVAQQVWDLKQAAEAQAGQVRANAALSDEERKLTLRAIQTEAGRAVAGALGQPGFAAYQKQMGGGWLRQLDSLTPPRRDVVIHVVPGP